VSDRRFSEGVQFMTQVCAILGIDPEAQPITAMRIEMDIQDPPRIVIERLIRDDEAEALSKYLATYAVRTDVGVA